MKILFAAPDRDLLECYGQLLEDDLGKTVTAFDGTQVLSLLSDGDFDILILDKKIPRAAHKTIIERANAKGVPVVLLTDEAAAARRADDLSPNVRLSYPFTFAKIKKTVLDTLDGLMINERKGALSGDE